MRLDEIIKQPENRKLEFKESLPNKIDLCKTIVSFANDAGGEIYIGVKNNPREIIGVPEEELLEIEETITNIISDNCYPIILPEISFINHDGKYVVVVKIYKGNNPPYYLKSKGKENGTYIRVGSSNRLANKDIIEELERQKQGISFDSLPVYSKSIDVLDISLFTKQFEEITGEKLTKIILNKLNLIVSDQNKQFPTNALILLSNDEIRNKLFLMQKLNVQGLKEQFREIS